MAAVLVTGHPRSGTQLLQRALDGHPAFQMTNEFGCFRALGTPSTLYGLGILGRCWARRRDPIVQRQSVQQRPGASRRRRLLESYALEARFLARLAQVRPPLVHAADVEALLRHVLPEARYVGDKLPDYVFSLEQFAPLDGVKVVVICRDGRDVVASYLNRLRAGGWDRLPVFGAFDTPRKIAKRWAEAARKMQRHRDDIFCVRYEDLAERPARVAARLGEWLDVDAGLFATAEAHSGSIGRYRERLSITELSAVEEAAGPTLRALGYD